MLGIDHLATRVLAGKREDALLEFLTMVPYCFWGAYNIVEMNCSTNVTRHPSIGDEKQSPARVFTANNTPSYLNSFDNLPMPTEDFVRNYGRRMHHIAFEVVHGESQGQKTWISWSMCCGITEYVDRCLGYDGFFTRDNVAALTAAAGQAER